MSAKIVFVFCVQAFLVQNTFTQAICPNAAGFGPFNRQNLAASLAGPAFTYEGLPAGYAGRPAMEFTATSGGSLPVTSSSAIAPTGISVVSENKFEGSLSVAGELPFVGTTAMEGAMPSAGAGAINHACGDGTTAMVSEAAVMPPAAALSPAGIAPAAGLGPVARLNSAAGLGLGGGLAPTGFGPANRLGLAGCGRIY